MCRGQAKIPEIFIFLSRNDRIDVLYSDMEHHNMETEDS